MIAAAQKAGRRPGWWYPYIYVGAFAVVFAVNGVFMYSAVGTFTGLVTDHPYEQGVGYNKVLRMASEQKALGWSVNAEVTSHPAAGTGTHEAKVVVSFRDKDGQPVNGLSVKAAFIRPTSSGHDTSVALSEETGGRYAAAAALPLGGQWELHVTARRGELDYQYDERIVVD